MDWVSKRLGLAKNAPTPINAVMPKEKAVGKTEGAANGGGAGGRGDTMFSRWAEAGSPRGAASFGGTTAAERDRNATKIRRSLRSAFKDLSLSKSAKETKNALSQALPLFCEYPFEIGKKEATENFPEIASFALTVAKSFCEISKTQLTLVEYDANADTKLGVCVFGIIQALTKISPTSEAAKSGKISQLQEKDPDVGISVFFSLSKILKSVTVGSSAEIGLPLFALIDIMKIGITLVRLYVQDISFLSKAQEYSAMSVLLDSMERAVKKGLVQRGVFIAKLLVELLKESLKKGGQVLDDFKLAGGYGRIAQLALSVVSEDNSMSETIESDIGVVVEVLEDLVYASRDDLTLSIEDGLTPYQQSDFRVPIAGSGATISSLESLEEFKKILCIDTTTTTLLNQTALIVLQKALAASLLEILKLNPINYFVMEKSRVFLYVLQALDVMNIEVQATVLDVVAYIVIDLNYVPFKELVSLCENFRGNSTSDTIASVCDLFQRLIDRAPKFRDTSREIGLVAMFGFMLQDYFIAARVRGDVATTSFNTSDAAVSPSRSENDELTPKAETASSPTVGVPSPSSECGTAGRKQNDFCLTESVLDNFEGIMKICSKLLENTQNAAAFRKSSRGAVYDLLADTRSWGFVRLYRRFVLGRRVHQSRKTENILDEIDNKVLNDDDFEGRESKRGLDDFDTSLT
ncbi:hypothetical protein BC829DRAFT_453913 [Chytridium lagenaria]|nr:hypothetical protein BC829DRAFT_453913 [Chytridium lagenaria]